MVENIDINRGLTSTKITLSQVMTELKSELGKYTSLSEKIYLLVIPTVVYLQLKI